VSWIYPDTVTSGDLFHSQADLDRMVADGAARGFQVAIHAIGDRGLDAALAALEHTLAGGPNTLRHRIEHNTFVRDDQLGRHARVGALATVFAAFGTCSFNAGGFARSHLVPAAEPYLWRWRDLVESNPGAHIAWKSDWPVFTMNPFVHLYGFVSRREYAEDGSLCQPEPEQANDTIPVTTALRMMTLEAAYALGLDSVIGSVEAGKLADLVILSDNPLAVPVDDLPRIQVLATLVGGKTRYCWPGAADDVCP
jgi:hypothetical protein